MTWQEMVRAYDATFTDEECDYILWELTAFPMALAARIARQLKRGVRIFRRNDCCELCGRVHEHCICPRMFVEERGVRE
jgi:hypothetical protein